MDKPMGSKKVLMVPLLLSLMGCLSNVKETQYSLPEIALVQVEPGTFTMGLNGDPREKIRGPEHKVTLTKSYRIGKYEVTIKDFVTVMNWGLSQKRLALGTESKMFLEPTPYYTVYFLKGYLPGENEKRLFWLVDKETNQDYTPDVIVRNGRMEILPGRENLPMGRVTWYGAAFYCNLLSEMAGLDLVYDEKTWYADFTKDGYRLPTEAEWVWAYRGGQESKGYEYSGSDDPEEIAWFSRVDIGAIPVGQLKPNELGIHDMAGNVTEWVNDWAEPFDDKPKIDPTGSLERWTGDMSWAWILGNYYYPRAGKVYKGGDFNREYFELLDTARNFESSEGEEDLDFPDHGFRVVLGRTIPK